MPTPDGSDCVYVLRWYIFTLMYEYMFYSAGIFSGNLQLLHITSDVSRPALFGVGGGEHVMEDVRLRYIKHALVVYVITVPINFMDRVLT